MREGGGSSRGIGNISCSYVGIYIEGDQDDPYTLENPPSFGLQDGREPFRSHNACKQVKIKF